MPPPLLVPLWPCHQRQWQQCSTTLLWLFVLLLLLLLQQQRQQERQQATAYVNKKHVHDAPTAHFMPSSRSCMTHRLCTSCLLIAADVQSLQQQKEPREKRLFYRRRGTGWFHILAGLSDNATEPVGVLWSAFQQSLRVECPIFQGPRARHAIGVIHADGLAVAWSTPYLAAPLVHSTTQGDQHERLQNNK